MSLRSGPQVFSSLFQVPETKGENFVRPPVAAVFYSSSFSPFVVCSVHLDPVKTNDENGIDATRTEAKLLGSFKVQTWLDGMLDSATGTSAASAHQQHGCKLILGDFNLGAPGAEKHFEPSHVGPGEAWKPLQEAGYKALLDSKEWTNFGPPVSAVCYPYDGVWW